MDLLEMGLLKFAINIREFARIEEVIETCWEKESLYYKSKIKTEPANVFVSTSHGKGHYISNPLKPALYDIDWVKENAAKQFVIIGTASNIASLEQMTTELTGYIAKLLQLYKKCEMELPADIQQIINEHKDISFKLKFSNRYVVE